jgi:hypothetical protein
MNQLETMPATLSPVAWDVDELAVRLQGKLSGRIRSFQLVLHDGGIILRGFARTYHAKQLAQHAVMLETDWPILANEIEVG